jgi:hypothetical protein
MIKTLIHLLVGSLLPKEHTMDLIRLKGYLMYVKGVKTFRLLFMSLLVMGVCQFLLLGSLVLFHATLFLYGPWSQETKMIIGFSFSAVYLLIAVVILGNLISERRWLHIFHADNLLDGFDDSAEEESALKRAGQSSLKDEG